MVKIRVSLFADVVSGMDYSSYANRIEASVTWYMPQSCGNITIDNTSLEAATYYNTTNWQNTCYSFWTTCFSPMCKTLAPPGTTYYVYPNWSGPAGYDYFDNVSPDTNCWPPYNL